MILQSKNIFFKALLLCLLFTITVRAQSPVASFSSDVQIGCAPLTVNFFNSTTGANAYNWSFGNTNTSTTFNPSTVYLVPGSYTVTLTATNTLNGLQSTATLNITVVQNPIADFTASSVAACEDENSICFNNTSQNSSAYTWDFGDGNSSTAVNPCHTYTNPGTYTVKLIAASAYGCQDIETKSSYIVINPKPAVSFTSNIQSTCNVNDVFNFTSTTAQATSWYWEFGDGATSTLTNPSHVYTASGNYSVSLVTANSYGCSDTLQQINYVNIGSSLVPSFTMSDTGGCAPFNITFDCTVLNATSWLWDFGDGNSSTQEDPVHTYSAPGNYSITLTVTTQSGCNGAVTHNNLVVVDNLPVPSFTVVQDSGCVPYTAQFVNTSTGAATYSWAFSSLGTSTQINPAFTFNNGGAFSVTLNAYSANGCYANVLMSNIVTVFDPSAAFTGTPLSGCPGMAVFFTAGVAQTNITNYQWSFGDGTFSSLQNPVHIYNTVGNYTVWLVVTNSFGCKDTVYKSNYVRVFPGIISYVVPDTIRICQNIPYTFSNVKPGTNSWSWNFGDGGSSTAQNPTYTYAVPGIYNVSLATGMAGGCNQTFNPVYIVDIVPFTPMPININYINRCKPYTVGFSTTTANITSYSWNFGDGSPASTLPAPIHVYQQAGTYSVVLSITVGSGCQTTLSTTVTVGHLNSITVDAQNVCKGNASNFTLLSPTAFTNVLWQFGNGNTSTTFNPSYSYPAAGSYNVSLIATDTSGCIDTFQLASPIVVNDPVANFNVSGSTTGCLSLPVQFNNTSTGANSYLWDFGDGTTDTAFAPTHTYSTAGVYNVTLTATINGCSDTEVKNNYIIIIAPQCNFMFNASDMCLPVTVTYTDLSPSAVSWLWDFGDGNSSTLQNPVHTFVTSPTSPVTLTITDQYGCVVSRTKTNINYYAASALVTNSSGCSPLTVSFSDMSVSATSWYWDFGDGNTSTAQNPSHTYAASGTYDVMLVATFPGNCSDTILYTGLVTVSAPYADFIAPAASGCSPINISFTNTSTDGVSFIWDFGDGSTSTNVNPTHIYNIPGFYTIQLIATSAQGCSDTMVKPNYIAIPGAYSNFTVSASVGCDTLSTVFTDQSINAISWLWNFGDGFTSTAPNPSHAYQNTGSYVVTLITQDTLGCTSVFTYPVPINVYPNPVASAFTTDTSGCTAYAVAFNNQSTIATLYEWHFGDGDTSTLINPTHLYSSAGVYYPYVIASTSYGCTDTFYFSQAIDVRQSPIAQFNALDTVCQNTTVTFTNQSTLTTNPVYTWDFGNSQTSNLQDPATTYSTTTTFTTSLVVTSNGCSDTAFHQLYVNPTPVAAASTSDLEGCQPYSVQFSNSSSGATTYDWQLEAGITNNTINPNHIYNFPGQYYPVLIASNSFGCTDTFTFTQPILVHAVPVTSFTPSATVLCDPATVTFTNTSTNLENPVYTWDFDTSVIMNSTNPAYTFPDSGTYDVMLYVVNTFGCSDSTDTIITVNASPAAIAFTSDTVGCSPYAVSFTNSSQFANNYLWDFGNGDTSTSPSPNHVYLSGGIYQPVLIAYNSYGCNDTLMLPPINVMQSPQARFTADDTTGCIGATISFRDASFLLQSPSYFWDFGFATSTLQNPGIVYNFSGLYNVSLLVTNNNGCTSSATASSYIEIYDSLPPPADPILSVSVVDDGSVDITWANSSVSDLGSYIVYRFNPGTGLYDIIYTDTNPSNSITIPASTYRDTGLATRFNTYTYLVQTVDICGNALPLNNLVAHTTINVSAAASGTTINVSWTPYIGCTLSAYEIHRTEVASGLSQLVATVSPSTLNITDTTLNCPFDYSYQIIALDLCGNLYTSVSDTATAQPANALNGQHVDVVRSTVVSNKQVLTEWLPPVLRPDRVLYYEVLRSVDNINFSPIALVPAVVTSYLDNAVDVEEQNCFYKIVVINDCNLSGLPGTEGASILLRGTWRNYKTTLRWTRYLDWDTGVSRYAIEKQNNYGVWEEVDSTNDSTFSIDFDE